eukprot:TRINITY_DN4241_c0_g1_i1.p1 TRINITY_DN4241_c0_g1~~TRINITY_DN4241_c0_g1_i1.p1  ORF type:complete len:388 (+),score=92.91 TRINITY_DN4241_c0_g1_i1:39-1202(+)
MDSAHQRDVGKATVEAELVEKAFEEKKRSKWMHPCACTCYLLLVLLGFIGFFRVACVIDSIYVPAPVMEDKIVVEEMKADFTVGFISDTVRTPESGQTTDKVFEMFKKANIDLLVSAGDQAHGTYEGWFDRITRHFGEYFPTMIVAGNHDKKQHRWERFAEEYERRAKVSGVKCDGRVGIRQTCHYGGLVVVSSVPALWRCGIASSSENAEYMDEQLSQYPDAPWKLCNWHIPDKKIHLSSLPGPVGLDIYDTCRKHGAGIINGHVHSYLRSFTISKFDGPDGMPVRVEGDTEDNEIQLKCNIDDAPNAQSFVFMSSAGKSTVYRTKWEDRPWMAKGITSDDFLVAGGLICKYNVDGNPKKATCSYTDIDGNVLDTFDIFTDPCDKK